MQREASCISLLTVNLSFFLPYSSLGMTVGGFSNISLPALEKRFQFNSKELGLIAASNDISSVLLICFVSFYGQFGNKVKWLGYGTIITGLCSLAQEY